MCQKARFRPSAARASRALPSAAYAAVSRCRARTIVRRRIPLDPPSWSRTGGYSTRRRFCGGLCGVAEAYVYWNGVRARVVGLVPLKSDSEALEALSGENFLRLHGERVMVHAVQQKGARVLPRGRGWYELLLLPLLLWVVCPLRGRGRPLSL